MAKVSLRINSGGIAAAANMFAAAPTPNLIILETSGEPAILLDGAGAACRRLRSLDQGRHHRPLQRYRALSRTDPQRHFRIYRRSRSRMPDILSAHRGDLRRSGSRAARPQHCLHRRQGRRRLLDASRTTAPAASPTCFRPKSILADLDLPYGTANIDFDQDPPQGIAEAVFSPERLDEVFLDRLLTKCSEHLSLLAAPSMLDRAYDFDATAFQPMIEVLQRSAPVTVLDVPHPGRNGRARCWPRPMRSSSLRVPDLANLRNAKNMLDALKKLRPNDKLPHLILNQVGMPKRPEISPRDFCEPLEIEPIAIIPFDAVLFGNAANSGRMIAEIDAKSPTAETFSQIAHHRHRPCDDEEGQEGRPWQVLACSERNDATLQIRNRN